jgi:cellulose synthase/poly-beta-1,6-N-acetylglucosamine synthase-like glycosyltransferase
MVEASQIIPHIFLFGALYFQIFLLITFFESREKIKKEMTRENAYHPSVTVLVPCYNEEKTVAGTVKSLLALDYPKDKLNIFIIDDGSTDRTFEIMKTFEQEPQVTLFQKENGGKHTALNLGIKHATSELVGCLDADSFVAPNALSEIVKYFGDATVMAVTPAVKIHNATTVLEGIQRVEYNMGIFLRKMLGFMDAIQITPGPFSIFRKRVFDELGGFREAHNTEDMEIALRMQNRHYRIENAHTAHVYTVAPKTIRKLYKQRVRWVYGFLKNALDYRHMLLNKKHGHLGLLALPFAIISVFSAIYMAGYTIIHLVKYAMDRFTEFQAIGIEINPPQFDWFFLNTQSLAILTTVALTVTAFIIFYGKKFSEGNMRPSRDMLYFFLLYGFIAPIWLTAAVFNVAFSKKGSWR